MLIVFLYLLRMLWYSLRSLPGYLKFFIYLEFTFSMPIFVGNVSNGRQIRLTIIFMSCSCLKVLFSAAYYNDVVVGGVCCRIDVSEGQRRLYIMTLGCLAPYRRLGIGSKMLEHVLNYVQNDANFHCIFL